MVIHLQVEANWFVKEFLLIHSSTFKKKLITGNLAKPEHFSSFQNNGIYLAILLDPIFWPVRLKSLDL